MNAEENAYMRASLKKVAARWAEGELWFRQWEREEEARARRRLAEMEGLAWEPIEIRDGDALG